MAITFPGSYGNTTLQLLCGGSSSVRMCVYSQSHVAVGVWACSRWAKASLDDAIKEYGQFYWGLMSPTSSLSLLNVYHSLLKKQAIDVLSFRK